MFVEVFDFLCKCLGDIFEVMKRFILFDNFTFYHFCIALMAIPIIIKLFHFIMGIEDEEANFSSEGEYIRRYDEYIGKHERYTGYRGKHELNSSYDGKHASYGKHGSRWL